MLYTREENVQNCKACISKDHQQVQPVPPRQPKAAPFLLHRMAPGAGLLSLSTPRKPEDVLAEDDVPADEPAEPSPKTPRCSFNTLSSDLPKGTPIPPNFRTHARHVMKFQQFLEELEESPGQLEMCVARARREKQRNLGWLR